MFAWMLRRIMQAFGSSDATLAPAHGVPIRGIWQLSTIRNDWEYPDGATGKWQTATITGFYLQVV